MFGDNTLNNIPEQDIHKIQFQYLSEEEQLLHPILPAIGQLVLIQTRHNFSVYKNVPANLISPNIVMTLGSHFNCSADELKFFQANFIIGSENIDVIQNTRYYKSKSIVFTPKKQIAVIELQEAVSIEPQIKLSHYEYIFEQSLHIVAFEREQNKIIGYQHCQRQSTILILHRVFHQAKFQKRENNHLFYKSKANYMIGAPLFTVVNGQLVMIGLSLGYQNGRGKALSFTSQLIQSIVSIAAQFLKNKNNGDYFENYDILKRKILPIKVGSKLVKIISKFDERGIKYNVSGEMRQDRK